MTSAPQFALRDVNNFYCPPLRTRFGPVPKAPRLSFFKTTTVVAVARSNEVKVAT